MNVVDLRRCFLGQVGGVHAEGPKPGEYPFAETRIPVIAYNRPVYVAHHYPLKIIFLGSASNTLWTAVPQEATKFQIGRALVRLDFRPGHSRNAPGLVDSEPPAKTAAPGSNRRKPPRIP